MSIGGNVAYYRRLIGWTQAELAARATEAGLAFHQPTIQRIEADVRDLRLQEAFALASILGCSVSQLSGLEDPQKRATEVSLRIAIEVLARELMDAGNQDASDVAPIEPPRPEAPVQTPKASAVEKLLSADEVAERVGIKTQTIYYWRMSGKGPRALRVGKYLRYRLSDVLAWEESKLAEDGER